MNNGIYCKQTNSSKLYNSIVLDEYRKCIFDETETQMNEKSSTMKASVVSSGATNSSEEEKWQEGQNVKAVYSVDGNYYEGIIKKILDNEYAVVRYLGYDNEEAVKLKDLRPSRGEDSIKEQIEKATLAHTDYKTSKAVESEDGPESEEEIEWKPGMPCRALYKVNDVIYEATVKQVFGRERKAIVIMAGYGIAYEVEFPDMYESIPELRGKQEKMAAKRLIEKKQEIPGKSSEPPKGMGLLNVANAEGDVKVFQNFQPVPGMTIPPPPLPDIGCTDKFPIDLNLSNPSTNGSCIFSQTQGMMQPQTENDALACLISSNYLSGYYAGFYDCLRKLQATRNS